MRKSVIAFGLIVIVLALALAALTLGKESKAFNTGSDTCVNGSALLVADIPKREIEAFEKRLAKKGNRSVKVKLIPIFRKDTFVAIDQDQSQSSNRTSFSKRLNAAMSDEDLTYVVAPDVELRYGPKVLGVNTDPSGTWGIDRTGYSAVWSQLNFSGYFAEPVAVVDTGLDAGSVGYSNAVWKPPNCFEVPETDNHNPRICCQGSNTAGGVNIRADEDESVCEPGQDEQILRHGTLVSSTLLKGQPEPLRIKVFPIKIFRNGGCASHAIQAWTTIENINKSNPTNKITVVNNSFGFYESNLIIQSVIYRFCSRGILLTAAAGNLGVDVGSMTEDEHLIASMNESYILGTAATDQEDLKWVLSNFGVDTIDIAAPGDSIMTRVLDQDNAPTPFRGTSAATAFASSAAALMRLGCRHESGRKLSAREIRNYLRNNTSSLPSLEGKVETGLLNVCKAVRQCRRDNGNSPVLFLCPN